MLEYNGKEFRTPLEQIFKNATDIEDILKASVALNYFGIEVVGVVETQERLPEKGERFGQAYAVGTDTPYNLFIWTREHSDSDVENGFWFNIGQFPMPGVQGPQGPQGIQGEQGPQGYGLGVAFNTIESPKSPYFLDLSRIGDSFLFKNGDIYTKIASDLWTLKFNIRGPQGIQGEAGKTPVITISNTGTWVVDGVDTGRTAIGTNGKNGENGRSFTIIAKLDSTDLLPDPYNTPRNDAYIINNKLYFITGDEDETTQDLMWEAVADLGSTGSQIFLNGVLQDSVELSDYATTTSVEALTNTVNGNTSAISTNTSTINAVNSAVVDLKDVTVANLTTDVRNNANEIEALSEMQLNKIDVFIREIGAVYSTSSNLASTITIPRSNWVAYFGTEPAEHAIVLFNAVRTNSSRKSHFVILGQIQRYSEDTIFIELIRTIPCSPTLNDLPYYKHTYILKKDSSVIIYSEIMSRRNALSKPDLFYNESSNKPYFVVSGNTDIMYLEARLNSSNPMAYDKQGNSYVLDILSDWTMTSNVVPIY